MMREAAKIIESSQDPGEGGPAKMMDGWIDG